MRWERTNHIISSVKICFVCITHDLFISSLCFVHLRFGGSHKVWLRWKWPVAAYSHIPTHGPYTFVIFVFCVRSMIVVGLSIALKSPPLNRTDLDSLHIMYDYIRHWCEPIAWSSFISPHTQINYMILDTHTYAAGLRCVNKKPCDWTANRLVCFFLHSVQSFHASPKM